MKHALIITAAVAGLIGCASGENSGAAKDTEAQRVMDEQRTRQANALQVRQAKALRVRRAKTLRVRRATAFRVRRARALKVRRARVLRATREQARLEAEQAAQGPAPSAYEECARRMAGTANGLRVCDPNYEKRLAEGNYCGYGEVPAGTTGACAPAPRGDPSYADE